MFQASIRVVVWPSHLEVCWLDNYHKICRNICNLYPTRSCINKICIDLNLAYIRIVTPQKIEESCTIVLDRVSLSTFVFLVPSYTLIAPPRNDRKVRSESKTMVNMYMYAYYMYIRMCIYIIYIKLNYIIL
jgi:hypothetical protein